MSPRVPIVGKTERHTLRKNKRKEMGKEKGKEGGRKQRRKKGKKVGRKEGNVGAFLNLLELSFSTVALLAFYIK